MRGKAIGGALLLWVGLGLPASAATIHTCVVGGVKTFQDSPCSEPEERIETADPGTQAYRQKVATLTLRRSEIIREMRHLTLQRQQDLVLLERRRLLNDEDPPSPSARTDLEAEYAQRLEQLRRKVERMDQRLAQIRRQHSVGHSRP